MKTDQELAHSLIELAPLMIRRVKAEIQTAAAGRLSHPQYRILANIQRGLNTVGQIAVHHGVSQPAMSKMVEILVQKGLIERKQKSKDRRQIQLQLSHKGKAMYQELKTSAAKSLAQAIAPHSLKDKQRALKAAKDLEAFLLKSQDGKEMK